MPSTRMLFVLTCLSVAATLATGCAAVAPAVVTAPTDPYAARLTRDLAERVRQRTPRADGPSPTVTLQLLDVPPPVVGRLSASPFTPDAVEFKRTARLVAAVTPSGDAAGTPARVVTVEHVDFERRIAWPGEINPAAAGPRGFRTRAQVIDALLNQAADRVARNATEPWPRRLDPTPVREDRAADRYGPGHALDRG